MLKDLENKIARVQSLPLVNMGAAVMKALKPSVVSLEPSEAMVWKGDLVGLLVSKEISQLTLPFILQLNELSSPADYDGTLTELLIFNEDEVLDLYRKTRPDVLKDMGIS